MLSGLESPYPLSGGSYITRGWSIQAGSSGDDFKSPPHPFQMVVSAACLEALENSCAFAIKAGLIGPESDAYPLSGGNHITRIMDYPNGSSEVDFKSPPHPLGTENLDPDVGG